MAFESTYPSLKPLKTVKPPAPKEAVPKGMVRASAYERERLRTAFAKPTER